ncbi:MAG TPA: ABC transporter permease [Egicoccus sp.]|nr:ABC transporter permease [Egicoccus sp.]HSK21562.1 ABC transporter permease [Egicoccus sp.]
MAAVLEPPELDQPTPPPVGGLESDAEKADSRRGFLVGLPSLAYLVVLFALPLVIVVVYSFATRSRTGLTVLGGWNVDSYVRLFDPLVLEITWRSLWMAALSTVLCLVVSYPFAYYLATRSPKVRGILLVLVMIPFWSNFLVRTYAWRVLLGSDGPLLNLLGSLNLPQPRLLFTPFAIVLGLVYGYLPFMVLPLYAAIERLDFALVEAARDLYASGWQAFRRVTWPLSLPGVIAGSVLVFIPSFGQYVTPELLGGSRTTMLGSYVVRQFLSSRDWPFGSALSVAILLVMLVAAVGYFRKGGRTL